MPGWRFCSMPLEKAHILVDDDGFGYALVLSAMWLLGMATADEMPLIIITGFFMHALSLAAQVWVGLVTAGTGIQFLWCVPAVGICAWLGLKVYRILNKRWLLRPVRALLLIFTSTLVF